ncbi:MAG: hypothetical protein WA705_13125 [Candidatus Ozemobacteraceae bacterium]
MSAGINIETRPMLSFTHFLYGTSGAFPPAAAFSRDWLRWKKVLDSTTEGDLDTIASYFRNARNGFPDDHAFECSLYQKAALCDDLPQLLTSWGTSVASLTIVEKNALGNVNELFDRVAKADPKVVSTELKRLDNHPAMRIFQRTLGEIKRFFHGGTSSEPWQIIAIPLRMTPQDVDEARKRGANSLFGRSFGVLQVVELMIIPEQPQLAESMLTGILGVALHEITHQLYATVEVGKTARLEMCSDQDRYGFWASAFLNEGLATALGNGFFASRLGSSDPQWYARSTVNSYGHALYPLVERYISEKKVIDSPFFLEARECFKHTFPRAQSMTEFSLLRFRLHGRQELKEAFSQGLKGFLPCWNLAEEVDSPRAEIVLVTPEDIGGETSLRESERGKLSLLARHKHAGIFTSVGQSSGVTRCLVLLQHSDQISELLGRLFSNRSLPRSLVFSVKESKAQEVPDRF